MPVASYLIDSDIVADALRGRNGAVQLLTRLGGEGLAISLVTYGEIYEGVYYSKDPQASFEVFSRFLRDVEVLSLDEAIMQMFGQLRGQLRSEGRRLADFDLLIASTAIHHSLSLVTRNTRHFERVPGINLYELGQQQ